MYLLTVFCAFFYLKCSNCTELNKELPTSSSKHEKVISNTSTSPSQIANNLNVINTQEYEELVNILKTIMLAQLNDTDTAATPTIPTSTDFNDKAGSLYAIIFKNLTEEVLVLLAEKLGKPNLLNGPQSLPPGLDLKEASHQIHKDMLDEMNKKILDNIVTKEPPGGNPGAPTVVGLEENTTSGPSVGFKDIASQVADKLIDSAKYQSVCGFSGIAKGHTEGLQAVSVDVKESSPSVGTRQLRSPDGKPSSPTVMSIVGSSEPSVSHKTNPPQCFKLLGDWFDGWTPPDDAEESSILGFQDSGSTPSGNSYEVVQEIYADILKQVNDKLTETHGNVGTSHPALLGFNGADSPPPTDFKGSVIQLKHLIDKEQKIRNVLNTGTESPSSNPGKGSVELLGGPNNDLVDAIGQFGLIYKKLLDENLKNSIALRDLTMTFKEPQGTPGMLSGNITLTDGVFIASTPLDVLEDAISVFDDKVVVLVDYIYNIKQESIKYQYVVEIPPEQMKGTLNASIRDLRTDFTFSAHNETDKCVYYPLGIHSRNPDFSKYEALFKTEQSLKDAQSTKKVEAILNTVVLNDMIRYKSKLPLIYDALFKISVNTTQKAADEFKLKTKKDLCTYNI